MLFHPEPWNLLRDRLHSEAFVLVQPVGCDACGGCFCVVTVRAAVSAACPVKLKLSALLLAFSGSLVLITGSCRCSRTSYQILFCSPVAASPVVMWPVPVLTLCLILCSKPTGTGT